MKSILVLALLLSTSLCLFADEGRKCAKPTHDTDHNPVQTKHPDRDRDPRPVPPVIGTPLSSTSTSNSSSSSSSSSSATATNGGNVQSQSENYNTPRQAPPAYAPTVFAGTCQGSLSGGVSAPIGGLSFGGTKADKVCQGINLSQVFISQGNYLAAAKVLCSLKPAKDAGLTMDDCMAFVRPTPVAPVAPVQVIVEPAIIPPATSASVTERVILPAATVRKAVKRHRRPCQTSLQEK